ncbi:MAG: hypothetical protein ABIR11_07145 [Candidatus Limnocylindrales bacterium]
MYDALLVLRTGWGRAELDTVSRPFREALTHALIAERLAPVLDDDRRILAMRPEDYAPKERPSLNRARMEASKRIDAIREYLGLDDPKGGK